MLKPGAVMRAGSIPVAVLVVLSAAPASAQEEQLNPAETRDRILRSWAAAEGAVVASRSRITVEFFGATKGEPLRLTRTDTLVNAFAPDCSLYAFGSSNPTPGESVSEEREITNSRYSAKIKNMPANGGWVLLAHRPAAEGRPRGGMAVPWMMLGNQHLGEFLARPTTALTTATRPRASVVRVHFSVTPAAGAPASAGNLRSGHIDFDEARYHCPLGYRFVKSSPGSEGDEIGTCEYAPTPGVPVITRAVIDRPDMHIKKSDARVSSREVWTYDLAYNAGGDETDFWLSHYGLPEPFGVTPPAPSRRYLWLVLAAVALAAVGIGLRVVAGRRRKAGGTS